MHPTTLSSALAKNTASILGFDVPIGDPTYSFSIAIEALKLGYRVCRAGWNGKGMWLSLTGASERVVRDGKFSGAAALLVAHDKPETVRINGHIDKRTADGSLTIGWAPSQPDMLAEDWQVLSALP